MPTNTFYPQKAEISDITNAVNAVVTFTDDHNFTNGEILGFRVGPLFGMSEIDRRRGRVLSNTSNTVTVDIDSSDWTAFTLVNLDTAGTSPPFCLPSSSGVVPNDPVPKTNLLDAFDNRRS